MNISQGASLRSLGFGCGAQGWLLAPPGLLGRPGSVTGGSALRPRNYEGSLRNLEILRSTRILGFQDYHFLGFLLGVLRTTRILLGFLPGFLSGSLSGFCYYLRGFWFDFISILIWFWFGLILIRFDFLGPPRESLWLPRPSHDFPGPPGTP